MLQRTDTFDLDRLTHAQSHLLHFLTPRLNARSMLGAISDQVTDEERHAFAQDLQRRIDSTRLRIVETQAMLDRSRRRLGEPSPAQSFGDAPSHFGRT